MVIRQLHVGWSVVPVEHDTVLIIDGNGPLAGAVAPEPMQPCAGVVAQVIQRGRGIEDVEPALGLSLDALEPTATAWINMYNTACVYVNALPGHAGHAGGIVYRAREVCYSRRCYCLHHPRRLLCTEYSL